MAVLDRGLKGVPTTRLKNTTGLLGAKMMCRVVAKDLYEGFPFAQYEAPVPIKVIGEYPDFITCEVLPHIANSTQRFGESKPYRISISKFALMTGQITLKPMD